jgi:hypothetical protein
VGRRMMEDEYINIYNIRLRLTSGTVDFLYLVPEITEYKIRYRKRGEVISKDGNRKAMENILIIDDIFIGSSDNIYEHQVTIIERLIPLLKKLAVINVADLKQEVWIKMTVKDQQFGLSLGSDLTNLLAINKYSILFSGI